MADTQPAGKEKRLSIALLDELAHLLRTIGENDKIRCIVTRSAGDSYSSGRDLYDMRSQNNRRRSRGEGGVAEIVSIMRKLPSGHRGGGQGLVPGRRIGHDQWP